MGKDKEKQSLRDVADNLRSAGSGEVRTVSETGGEKGVKAERFSLIPWKAVAAIGRQFNFGAEKYDDHNWRKGYEWSKSYDALMRHLTAWWEGEDVDEESGMTHLAAAGFHVLVLISFEADPRYKRFDNRYKPEPKPKPGFASGGFIPGVSAHGLPKLPEGYDPVHGAYYTANQMQEIDAPQLLKTLRDKNLPDVTRFSLGVPPHPQSIDDAFG